MVTDRPVALAALLHRCVHISRSAARAVHGPLFPSTSLCLGRWHCSSVVRLGLSTVGTRPGVRARLALRSRATQSLEVDALDIHRPHGCVRRRNVGRTRKLVDVLAGDIRHYGYSACTWLVSPVRALLARFAAPLLLGPGGLRSVGGTAKVGGCTPGAV